MRAGPEGALSQCGSVCGADASSRGGLAGTRTGGQRAVPPSPELGVETWTGHIANPALSHNVDGLDALVRHAVSTLANAAATAGS